jgi:choline kinase
VHTVILAAGQGTRLGRHAKDRPKCLVELGGRRLLDRSLDALRRFEQLEVTAVGGVHADMLRRHVPNVVVNSSSTTTNIVGSLARGLDALGWPATALVVYGDIVFEPRAIAAALVDSDADVVLPVNTAWRDLWGRRMEDPLSDAETLTVSADGSRVTSIGAKPAGYDEVHGQFMGILRMGPAASAYLRDLDQNRRDLLDTTTMVSEFIRAGLRVAPVPVDGGWLEVDTEADLDLYRSMLDAGTLDELCRLDDPEQPR